MLPMLVFAPFAQTPLRMRSWFPPFANCARHSIALNLPRELIENNPAFISRPTLLDPSSIRDMVQKRTTLVLEWDGRARRIGELLFRCVVDWIASTSEPRLFRQLDYRSLRPTAYAVALPEPEPRAVG